MEKVCKICRCNGKFPQGSLVCRKCISAKRMIKLLEKGAVKNQAYLVCALPGFRYCGNCKEIHTIDSFALNKSTGKPRNVCRECNNAICSEKYYASDTKQFNRNNYERTSEKIKERNRQKYYACREDPVFLAKQRQKALIFSRLYYDTLADTYIKSVIRIGLKKKGIILDEIPEELIAARKLQLQFKREHNLTNKRT